MLLLLCVKKTELLLENPSETIINVISPFVCACFVVFFWHNFAIAKSYFVQFSAGGWQVVVYGFQGSITAVTDEGFFFTSHSVV